LLARSAHTTSSFHLRRIEDTLVDASMDGGAVAPRCRGCGGGDGVPHVDE
jgi:hypothetical protein